MRIQAKCVIDENLSVSKIMLNLLSHNYDFPNFLILAKN